MTHLVHGVVGEADGSLDFVLDIVGPGDAVVGRIEGSVKAGDVIAAGQEIARQAAEIVCAKKAAWHVSVGYYDLTIDQAVCDVTVPFVLTGSGASAGLSFSLVPDGSGGTWTVGGLAAGVPWSGGGDYTLATGGGAGQMALSGAWQITSPMGVYKDSGTIPAVLTALEPC
jgi:hypothetical protein